MTCPDDRVLYELLTASSGPESNHDSVGAHIASCEACRQRQDELRTVDRELKRSHAEFQTDHDRERARLLRTITADDRVVASRSAEDSSKGRRGPIIRRLPLRTMGAVGVAVVVLGAVTLFRTRGIVAQVAKQFRSVKSYSCELHAVGKDDQTDEPIPDNTTKCFWKSPGVMRMETFEDGRKRYTDIYAVDKTGISINHDRSTYAFRSPRNVGPGRWSLGHWMMQIEKHSGFPNVDFGISEIDGHRVHGFQIDGERLESGSGIKTIRLWADVETRLPVRVEMDLVTTDAMMRFDTFRWNESLDDSLFAVVAPSGYQDRTREPRSVREKEKHLVHAFRTFGDKLGYYPQVETIYGDVVHSRLREAMSIPRKVSDLTKEHIRSDDYANLMNSTLGWAIANELMRDNPGVAYFGMTVDPGDADNVLFRWKRDDGRYQVIYGDLQTDTLTAAELREVEK